MPVGDRLLGHYQALLTEMSADAWRAVVLFALEQTRRLHDGGRDPRRGRHRPRRRARRGAPARGTGHRRPRAALPAPAPADRRPAARDARPATRGTPGARRAPASPTARRGGGIWPRAAAGPDDVLADELARVAATDRARLGFAAASAALERSGLLTRSSELAAERLAAAAEDAFVAGDVPRTRALVDRVLDGLAAAPARGRALFTLGMLEQYAGSVPRSVDHLSAACDLLDGLPLVRALSELGDGPVPAQRLGAVAECADRLGAVADHSDPEQRLLARFAEGASLMLG